MNIIIAGGKHASDSEHTKWYLGVLHSANTIENIVFFAETKSGVYKSAKEWAMDNKVNHREYPAIHSKFLDYEKDIDCVVCFPAAYSTNAISGKIKRLAESRGIRSLMVPTLKNGE